MGRAGPGPSIKVRGWEGPACPGPVDKSEGLGWPGSPPSLANPHMLARMSCKPSRDSDQWFSNFKMENQGMSRKCHIILTNPFRWHAGLRRLGLRHQAWLIEARGLANRSEGLGWLGNVDKGEGFRWPGWPRPLISKVLGGLHRPRLRR